MVGHQKHRREPGRPGQGAASKGSRPKTSTAAPPAPKPAVAPRPVASPPIVPAGPERVAKVLARAGVASRREVERLIAEGKVALNGQVLDTPAVTIGAGDRLTVEGRAIAAAEPTRLFRYHKPSGLVTSHNDPKGRPTVFDALPPGLPRVISVGRLDLNSEGLLLLTNDGGLSRALELPSSGWPRRYRARAWGRIDQARLDTLQNGITVEGVHYGAIDAKIDKAKDGPTGANLWITLTLVEGKNREIRRVLEALGLTVNRLIRLAYGPFALGTLEIGAVEEVGPRVIREQLAGLVAPANMPTGDRATFKSTGGLSRRTPTAKSAAAAARAAGETPAAKVYKPGWARPKKIAPGGITKIPKARKPEALTAAKPGPRSRPPRKPRPKA